MGGALHVLLVQAALGAGVSLVAFFSALAWSASGLTSDGSVVASRLREKLPSLTGVVAGAVAWYAFAEAVEPQHAGASPLVAVTLLVACAWLVLHLAGAVARVIGAAIFSIRRAPFAARLPLRTRRPQRRPLSRRPLLARRRYARPPPIVAVLRA